MKDLYGIVDAHIGTREDVTKSDNEEKRLYDISQIDFERLRQEFARSTQKNTTVQSLKHAVEKKLARLMMQNPLRTNYQRHYEELVKEYNQEKDQVVIENTFEALLKLDRELSEEEKRAVREGLDEESLALFDLLSKPDLPKKDISRIKKVAASLLDTLKSERLKIANWRQKESTRDAVKQQIFDFLYDDRTGLPVDDYEDEEISVLTEKVFLHVYRAYPSVPSPIYN